MADHERGQVDTSAAEVYDTLFVPALFGGFVGPVMTAGRIGPDDSVAGALSCTFPTWIRDERGIDHEIESVLQAAAASP